MSGMCVEYKAECRDIWLARSVCLALGASYVIDIDQTDTHFRVAHGHLKRRESHGLGVEYIVSDRVVDPRPSVCRYTVMSDEQGRARFGAVAPPTLAVVRKHRCTFAVWGVRVHLDEVFGLGMFVKLGAGLQAPGDEPAATHALLRVRESMLVVLGEPIGHSYGDLVAMCSSVRV